MHRLFIALLPDNATKQEIIKRCNFTQKPLINLEKLHITLLFLGNQPSHTIKPLSQWISSVDFKPFQLVLNQVGRFNRLNITWVGPSVIPDELTKLRNEVTSFAMPSLIKEHPGPFRPHITLSRKLNIAPHKIEPIYWNVNHLALIESHLQQGPNGTSKYNILCERYANL